MKIMTNRDRITEFEGKLERVLNLEQYAPVVEGRANANEALHEAMREYAGEYADAVYPIEEQRRAALYSDALVQGRTETLEDFAELKDEVLGNIPQDKLSRVCYQIMPQNVEGNDAHNAIAKKHQKAHLYEQAYRSYAEGKTEIFEKQVRPQIEKEIVAEVVGKLTARLSRFSEARRKRFINHVLPFVLEKAFGDDRAKLALLEERYSEAKKEFEDSFANDEARAEYARTNLSSAYAAAKDENEKFDIIKTAYAIKRSKQ